MAYKYPIPARRQSWNVPAKINLRGLQKYCIENGWRESGGPNGPIAFDYYVNDTITSVKSLIKSNGVTVLNLSTHGTYSMCKAYTGSIVNQVIIQGSLPVQEQITQLQAFMSNYGL
jgi:hypothetical protein